MFHIQEDLTKEELWIQNVSNGPQHVKCENSYTMYRAASSLINPKNPSQIFWKLLRHVVRKE
jgi:hypothetical protein